MKATIVLLALLGIMVYVQASEFTLDYAQEIEWELFKLEFKKSYDNEAEENLRKLIFQENKKTIEAHNARWAAGEESYEMGVNQFTDMWPDETSEINAGNDDQDYVAGNKMKTSIVYEDTDLELPGTVNWTQRGAVTPVMCQGRHNTSWAFATAGVIESHQFIKHGRLVALSKQNLIDCCPNSVDKALICIKNENGIDTEASYRFCGAKHSKCGFKPNFVGAKINRVFQVWPGNETLLAYQVAYGPVAAVIPQMAITSYKGGIFYHPRCGPGPDFAVLIVGYGTCKKHGDYWILKTSLGTKWGERGYMKLARNRKNQCGIANKAFFPDLK